MKHEIQYLTQGYCTGIYSLDHIIYICYKIKHDGTLNLTIISSSFAIWLGETQQQTLNNFSRFAAIKLSLRE